MVRRNRYVILLTVIATVPVLAAFLKAVAHGWWPDGDDAILGMKVADVFSSHPPTMGMRSTSGNADPSLASHHPGPMAMYLLAIPAGLFGFHPIGLLLGSALTHIALIVGVVIVARRRGGMTWVLMALTAVLVIQWAVGPEALFRPLNPYPASIGVFLLLLLTWSLVVGDTACAWGFVLVASLVAQANLAFLPLVVALTLLVVVTALLRRRRSPSRGSIWAGLGLGRGASRTSRLAAGALVLCWLPPLVEMVTYRKSNPLQVASYIFSGVDKDQMGWASALKAFLPQLVPFPGGFSSANNALIERSGLWVVLGLVVVAMLAGLAVPAAEQLPGWDSPHRMAAVVALVALVLVGWSFASAPTSVVGVPFYWLLPIWGCVTFAWLVLGSAVFRAARHIASARRGRAAAPAAPAAAVPARGVSVVLLGILAIVATQSPVVLTWRDEPGRKASAIVAEEYSSHTPPPHPVRVTSGGGWVAWASVAPAIAYQLRARGYDVYSMTDWPLPEDVSFRHATKAPTNSSQIFVREKAANGQWVGEPDGSGWRLLGTVEGKPVTGQGELEVYLREPGW
ncbi:hypothetical protein N802_12010 [Knoellia sinensis KCTC 19936]|uniref:Glycosyltransferase RgtA/B/C/D-like domain-containing protein n=1 Tax=Knoellia sinensis KCTC 19936 TaxID=1385520 RepID=A0A0A0JE87_9MICO|nr:hypothetical protein [Knoellia sinensis]KGN34377.1 hypothetical protein N802_12010 [Knoellia sinensis KCTC 19936]